MTLHIFTLNWNGIDKLIPLKNSLLPALDGIDYQWHIKDNGSSDGSYKTICDWNEKRINCLKYPTNYQNFSEGNNFIYNEAKPNDEDHILLLNNDIVVDNKNSIKNMIDVMSKDKTVGVVGAKLLYPSEYQRTLQHAGVTFSKRTNSLPTHFRAREKDDDHSSKNREFQAITGAVLLTTGENYRRIVNTNKSKNVGLPENLSWCFEDIWACLSIKYDLGKKIVYCGNTSFFHEESATLAKNPVNKLMLNQNCREFLTAWGGRYSFDRELYINDKNYKVIK